MFASTVGTLVLAAQPLPGARPPFEGDTLIDAIAVAVLVTVSLVLVVLIGRRVLRE